VIMTIQHNHARAYKPEEISGDTGSSHRRQEGGLVGARGVGQASMESVVWGIAFGEASKIFDAKVTMHGGVYLEHV